MRYAFLMLLSSVALMRTAQAEPTKVDFLWVVDNSPSMADEQAALAAAADDIASRLAHGTCPVDWRMAVAYTDLNLPPGPDDVCPGAPGPGRRRVCPFTRDLDAFRNGTPECAYVKAGTCGGASERGFDGARVAIDRFLAGTGCEPVPGAECALRPDARLVVVFFTDTGEQTPDSQAPPGQPDNSVASWVRYFGDYDVATPGAQVAQVHGILCPLRPGSGDTRPCSDNLLDPALYDRYPEVIDRLGGTEGSIRNDDSSHLSDTIARIVEAAVAGACCGNGIVEAGEQCDTGTHRTDCCSPGCRLEPVTTICRPATGPCDLPENCDGSSPVCPADRLAPDGTACDDQDACTLTDTCETGQCTGHDEPDCDDGDRCTADSCLASTGCVHRHPDDASAITCLCAGGLDLPTCAGQRPPAALGRRFGRACRLIARAATLHGSKARSLMAKAAHHLKQADAIATKATKRRKLSPVCATSVSRQIRDLRTGVLGNG